jgi:hypothetical protein
MTSQPDSQGNQALGQGSLLEGIEAAPVAPGARRGPSPEQVAAANAKRAARRERWNTLFASKRFKNGVIAALVVAALGSGGGALWYFRFREPPDYDIAGLDSVFDYTLLQDDFNKLPVKQRLELISKLVQRLKNMNSGDSALMAAFAAGIAGQAREQLEKNASRVMLDMTDQYAIEYEKLEGAEKDKYLETAMADMFRTMDGLDGTPSTKTNEEILADAKRDSRNMKDRAGKLDDEQKGRRSERMFSFMREGLGGHSSPAQRARLTGFMRDMGRTLRGEGRK